MQVVILTRNFGTEHGVSGKRVLDLANQFLSYGATIAVIAKQNCIDSNNTGHFDIFPYTHQNRAENKSALFNKCCKILKNEIGNSEFQMINHDDVLALILEKVPDEKFILISSAPPFELHKIAQKVKSVCGERCIWVADFRDPPLLNIFRRYSGFSKIRRSVACATVLTTTTSRLGSLLGFSQFLTLPNGCNISKQQPSDKKPLRFIYGGSLKNSERRSQLDKILCHINTQIPSAYIDLFCGDINSDFIGDYRNTTLYQPQSHADFVHNLKMYSHGISLTKKMDYYAVPMKIYEYLNANLNVVAVCPNESAVADLSNSDSRIQVFPIEGKWERLKTKNNNTDKIYSFDAKKLVTYL